MVKVKNYHEEIEKDLQKLITGVKEFQEKIKSLEKKETPPTEKEMVKEALKVFQPPVEKPPAPPPPKKEEYLPHYLKDDEEVKKEVNRLVDLAFKEGIEKAVKEAKSYSPFIEDAFHDALVEKILPILKERGII